MAGEAVTFVVAVNDEETYENNFLASPLLARDFAYEVLAQRAFPSAAKAYNQAIDQAEHDLIVFVHQDMVFPGGWLDDLTRALEYLEKTDPSWGVLGCVGVTKDFEWIGDVFCTSNRVIYPPFDRPMPIRTLDEVVLILRRSSGLRFDENLPHFHFYGTDICMNAESRGRTCYSIPAFCLHNSNKTVLYPPEFFEACNYIRKRWRDFLPIHTSCVTITPSVVTFYMEEKYLRTLKYYISRLRGTSTPRNMRVKEPLPLLEELVKRERERQCPAGADPESRLS